MQELNEVQSKRKLQAPETAHFFFNILFLIFTGVIQYGYSEQKCNVDFQGLIQILFYGFAVWTTYIIITILPKYKTKSLRFLFTFFDVVFALFSFTMFIYANILYFNNANNCRAAAPVLNFFIEMFLWFGYILFGIIIISLFMLCLKCLGNQAHVAENEKFQ